MPVCFIHYTTKTLTQKTGMNLACMESARVEAFSYPSLDR